MSSFWDKLKLVLIAFFSILSTVLGFILLFKKNKPSTIDNTLADKEKEITNAIEKANNELNQIKENGVKNLTDQEIVDYWNKNL